MHSRAVALSKVVVLGLALALGDGFFSRADAKNTTERSFKSGVQEIIEDVQFRCRHDLQTFCDKSLPDKLSAMHCLAENSEKRSPKCDYAVFDAKRAIDGLLAEAVSSAQICRQGIGGFCQDMTAGTGQISQCLVDHQKSLSGKCREFVAFAAQAVPHDREKALADSSFTEAAPKRKACRTLAYSVTDLDQSATSRDATELLAVAVREFAEERGLENYDTGPVQLSCKNNTNMIIISTHNCRAQAEVCWRP